MEPMDVMVTLRARASEAKALLDRAKDLRDYLESLPLAELEAALDLYEGVIEGLLERSCSLSRSIISALHKERRCPAA